MSELHFNGASARLMRISASAGTGKTFRLALRAIELMRAGADPATLLATTFTRAAAGEIRDRVIGRLCEAATNEHEREKLERELAEFTPRLGDGRGLDADRAAALVRSIAASIDRLQIRTLDSIFSGYVSAFAGELGLPAAVRIQDPIEDAGRGRRALDAVLDRQVGERTFVETLRTLTQGRADAQVEAALFAELGDAHLAWVDGGARPEPWQRVAMPPAVDAGDIDRAAEVIRLAVEGGLKPKGVLEKIVQHAIDRNWAGLSGQAATKRTLERDPGLANDRFDTHDLPRDVMDAYRTIIAAARHGLVGPYVRRAGAIARLCEAFDSERRRLGLARGILSFADLVTVLAEAMESGRDVFADPGWIEYRLDGSIGHVLLDEFQDTSLPQWAVVRRLLEPIVGDSTDPRSLFVVGDAKQSIYGFRGGCPDLLERLDAVLIPGTTVQLAETHMEQSQRSSPEIMKAVNEVFDSIRTTPGLVSDPVRAGVDAFANAWRSHEAASRHAHETGYAELRVAAERREGEDVGRPLAMAMAEQVVEWHRRSPDASIAVLVRRNSEGAEVAAALAEIAPDIKPGLPGGRPLETDPVAAAVLSLLHLADHPDDTAAFFHVCRTPVGRAVGVAVDAADSGDERVTRRASRLLAARLRRRIAADGLDGLLASVTESLAGDPAAADDLEAGGARCLRVLGQLAAAAVAREGHVLRPAAFVRMVAGESVPDLRPAPVQIVTMHRSKGLEYDVVVMSTGHDRTRLVGRPPSLLIHREDPTGPITLAMPWINKDVRRLIDDPRLRLAITSREAASVREVLCVLYVAMTRAKHVLSMIMPAPTSADSYDDTTLAVVRGALVRGAEQPPEPGSVAWSTGTIGEAGTTIRARHEADRAKGDGPPDPMPGFTLSLSPARRPLVAAAGPASAEGERTTPLAERLRPAPEEPRARGSAIHAMLEQIRWLEDDAPSDAALLAASRAEVPGRAGDWHAGCLDELKVFLGTPAASAVLTRASRSAATIDVHAERRFARLTEEGVETGIIDRLELDRATDGTVTGIRIIDWKTDSSGAAGAAGAGAKAGPAAGEDLARRAIERYGPQLQRYAEAVRGLAPDGTPIEAALVFTGAAAVVEVPVSA